MNNWEKAVRHIRGISPWVIKRVKKPEHVVSDILFLAVNGDMKKHKQLIERMKK